jgi:hypothetical protein
MNVETPRLWTPRRRTDKRICAPPPPPPYGFGVGLQRPDPAPLWPMYYPNLWQWCAGDAGIVSSGGVASEWQDRSTAKNGYNQTSAGLTVVTSGGFPGLESAAGTRYLQTANATAPTYKTFKNHTLFAVVKPTSPPASQIAYGRILDNDYVNSFYLGLNSAGTEYQYIVNDSGIGTCEGGTVTSGTMVILTAIYNSTTTTGTLQVNGMTVNSETFTAPSLSSTANVEVLTYSGTAGTNGFLGIVFEVMIYTDAKTGSALTQLNRYLGYKYNISVP